MSTTKKTETETAQEELPTPVTDIEPRNLTYLGPTITGVITHDTTFKDGILPDSVKNCIKEYPPMEKLFVPIDQIVEVAPAIANKVGHLYVIYQKVNEKFNNK